MDGLGCCAFAYHPGPVTSQKLSVGNVSICGVNSDEQPVEHLVRSVFHAQVRQSVWPRRKSEPGEGVFGSKLPHGGMTGQLLVNGTSEKGCEHFRHLGRIVGEEKP